MGQHEDLLDEMMRVMAEVEKARAALAHHQEITRNFQRIAEEATSLLVEHKTLLLRALDCLEHYRNRSHHVVPEWPDWHEVGWVATDCMNKADKVLVDARAAGWKPGVTW